MTAQKITRRNMLKLLGATTAGAALAACAAPAAAPKAAEPEQKTEEQPTAKEAAPQGETKVILMYNANEISDPEIADFNKKYAPIVIERIDTDLVKFFSMVAAGTQVDGVRLYGVNIPVYVTKKVTMDLTDYFKGSSVVKVDDLFPVNDMFVYGGKRYGMVKDWSPDVSIWINKKVWGEMGVPVPEDPTQAITYQEWRELAPKLMKKQGDQIIIFGTDFEPHTNPLFWATTTFEPPATLFNADFTKMALKDNPTTLEAIKFFTDWQLEKTIPSVLTGFATAGGWSGPDWQAAQAAAVQWGYWFSGMAESDKVNGEDIFMMRAPQWGPELRQPDCLGLRHVPQQQDARPGRCVEDVRVVHGRRAGPEPLQERLGRARPEEHAAADAGRQAVAQGDLRHGAVGVGELQGAGDDVQPVPGAGHLRSHLDQVPRSVH